MERKGVPVTRQGCKEGHCGEEIGLLGTIAWPGETPWENTTGGFLPQPTSSLLCEGIPNLIPQSGLKISTFLYLF